MTVPPSGEQFAIAAGDQRATIVEVGGGIHAYQVADRPVRFSSSLQSQLGAAERRLSLGLVPRLP